VEAEFAFSGIAQYEPDLIVADLDDVGLRHG
jgi:hypothetical protein